MEYVRQERPNLFQNAMVINEGGGFPLHINGKNYMMLTVGEKAVCKIKISAEGTGGHASAPGENQALLKLAEGLRKIFAAEKELTCGSRRTWETMRRIVGSDSWDNATGADIFAYASQNSIGMRNYSIGERSNVIPAHVEAVLEFKVLPYGSQEEIETFVRKQIAGLPLEMEVLGYEAGFESNFENSHLKQLVNDLEEACRRFGFDGGVLPMLALGRTDGRFFGSAGSMVYGCSPLLMGDSFDAILPKVHGRDESILETSYEFGAQVLDEVIQKKLSERRTKRRQKMKDYSYHKKVIDDVITKLNESDIDLYLIITAEGCDPMTEFIPGVDTVGSSAFLFTKDGKKLATASSIDAQDVEESGLFDEVRHYENYDETLAQMVLN